MNFPTTADLPGEDERASQLALSKAIRATTRVLRVPLIEQRTQETILIGMMPQTLKHPAIGTPYATDETGKVVDVEYDSTSNTVTSSDTPRVVHLVYTWGYVSGELPAIVREIIILLSSWFLLKESHFREEAKQLLRIVRGRSDQTHRAFPGEGPSRDRPGRHSA